MAVSGVKTIRALERGLSVGRLLHRLRSASLHELHLQSGLPKPTLERILLTLQQEGFATRRIADGRWVAGYGARELRSRFTSSDLLGQAAVPVLDELCSRILWPSDLTVRVGTHMELRESSRPHSTFVLSRLYVGYPVNMLLSAPGRAYLANCPDEERESVLARMRAHKGPDHNLARDGKYVDRILADTRRLGYGPRDPVFGGHITKSKTKFDDGLDAIAVPVMRDDAVLGCINIVWTRHRLTQAEVAGRHLDDLKEAAANIGHAYGKMVSRHDSGE
jgi:IclR family mhp operon transcriptional activator